MGRENCIVRTVGGLERGIREGEIVMGLDFDGVFWN